MCSMCYSEILGCSERVLVLCLCLDVCVWGVCLCSCMPEQMLCSYPPFKLNGCYRSGNDAHRQPCLKGTRLPLLNKALYSECVARRLYNWPMQMFNKSHGCLKFSFCSYYKHIAAKFFCFGPIGLCIESIGLKLTKHGHT